MIQVKLTDSNNVSLQLGDIMVVHYPNPKIKFFGLLNYVAKEGVFILDAYGECHPFNKNLKDTTYERLAGEDVLSRELIKELGRVEVKKVKEFDKIYNLCR